MGSLLDLVWGHPFDTKTIRVFITYVTRYGPNKKGGRGMGEGKNEVIQKPLGVFITYHSADN